MDALDIRILRAMGPLPYGPRAGGGDAIRPARLARAIGVSAETVRDRVARMEASGVIAGYEIVPNLRHFGLTAAAYFLRARDDAARERLLRTAATLEGLLETTQFLSGEVCVDLSFATKAQLDRRLRALADAAGDPAPGLFLGWHMPTVERALTTLDLKLLRALRHDAKRPLPEVAEELGVGYRTAKRAYDRLIEEHSLFVKVLVDPAAEPGLIPFTLLFRFRRDAPHGTAAEVLRAFDEHFIFAQAPHTQADLDIVVFASSSKVVDELRRRGAAIAGVEEVEALVLTSIESRTEWIDDLIAARLAEGGVASPAA